MGNRVCLDDEDINDDPIGSWSPIRRERFLRFIKETRDTAQDMEMALNLMDFPNTYSLMLKGMSEAEISIERGKAYEKALAIAQGRSA